MTLIEQARDASPETAQQMLEEVCGAIPILLARTRRQSDPEPPLGSKLEVRLPEAAHILGVTETFLRDHHEEYGGFKRGKFWTFSLERLRTNDRRKAMVGRA